MSEYERFGFAMLRLEERWLGRGIHRSKIGQDSYIEKTCLIFLQKKDYLKAVPFQRNLWQNETYKYEKWRDIL